MINLPEAIYEVGERALKSYPIAEVDALDAASDVINDIPCPPDCPSAVTPLFEEVESVEIPQWSGLHDRLGVYRRIVT